MTKNEFGKLVRLSDVGETVVDKSDDVRGRKVIDKNGDELGKIDALLVDDRERKVRFLEVASGGFLGLGEHKSLIPIDAITQITEHQVHIDQEKGHVAGAPHYEPELGDTLPAYADIYGYYGYLPYWGLNYAYPSYPSYAQTGETKK